MRKGFLKKILGLGAAIAMIASTMMPVSADPVTVTSATEMDGTYFSTLSGVTGTPSLTIAKYVTGSNGNVDETQPIKDVKFKYVKVGGLYEVKTSTETAMAYGITKEFAGAIGLVDSNADYTDNSNVYFKNGETIQNAVRGKTKTELDNYLKNVSATEGKTNDSGIISATLNTPNSWGLYLVVETDVSEAKIKNSSGAWEAISITQIQKPFIAAVPILNADGTTWNDQVVAQVKNSIGSADIEKKIITSDAIPTTVTEGNYDDTDITSIGDTVYFRLKGTVVPIPAGSSETIEKYVMTDNISKGLSPNLEQLVVKTYNGTGETPLIKDTDYEVSSLESYSGSDKEFTDGQKFTITFTTEGRRKLTTLAQDPGTTKEVYAYYPATVTTDAVIGEKAEGASNNSGNPNQVMLTYTVSGSKEMNTGWDTVTEFTFGIDVTKTLEGDESSGMNMSQVKFKVYSGSGAGKTYYTFDKVSGSNGVYTTPTDVDDNADAIELSPAESGQIQIKGLEEGTYYLEEVATAEGYNLLKEPVKFEIQSTDKAHNTFVGSESQYLGTLKNDTDGDGYMEAEVVNTKGFTLPATGGAGIWMFVLGGAAVILAGCAYFAVTRKNRMTK